MSHLFISPGTFNDFGLANRLRGYVGAWACAQKTQSNLDVMWTPSAGCPYNIEDLFEPLPMSQFIKCDTKTEHYIHVTSDHGHLYHILQREGLPYNIAPALIALLKPVQSIRQKLDTLTPLLVNAIGVHVRRTDHIDYANNYGGPTPLKTYFDVADATTSVIFVACDEPSTLESFKQRYGNDRIITAKEFNKPVSALRFTDGEHAVLDLYSLALCAQFVGSNASSFSAHVMYLREHNNNAIRILQ